MASAFVEVMKEIKGDFMTLAGLAISVGQMAFLQQMLSLETASIKIYCLSALLFLIMIILVIRCLLKVKQLSSYSKKRRLYKFLAIAYVIMALMALIPAAYRWRYVKTDWIPASQTPTDPEPGLFMPWWLIRIQATSAHNPLEISMYLDPMRTSLECSRNRNPRAPVENVFDVEGCAEYSISEQRLRQIMKGHGLEKDDAEWRFAQEGYSISMMSPAFQALKIVTEEYRKKHDPLFDEGPEIMYRFSKGPSGKMKLLSTGLLPNAEEWQLLTKQYPALADALRSFVIEWVGFLDPLFHVTFRNTTSKNIEISKMRYTANPRRGSAKTRILGAYEIPRYLIELEEGAHEEDIPPVEVPAKSSKAIDILLRLRKENPGVTYDIQMEFVSRNPSVQVRTPAFAITFTRIKNR